jgi:hypothetical protein
VSLFLLSWLPHSSSAKALFLCSHDAHGFIEIGSVRRIFADIARPIQLIAVLRHAVLRVVVFCWLRRPVVKSRKGGGICRNVNWLLYFHDAVVVTEIGFVRRVFAISPVRFGSSPRWSTPSGSITPGHSRRSSRPIRCTGLAPALHSVPLTVLSPGPRLAGMPAKGQEMEDGETAQFFYYILLR